MQNPRKKLADDNAGVFIGVFRADSVRLETDISDTMRDLAVASLATAAGAMGALVLDRSHFCIQLFFFGILVLVIDTMLIFNLRIRENFRMRESLISNVHTYAAPWIRIKAMYANAREGDYLDTSEADMQFDATNATFRDREITDVNLLTNEFKRDRIWPLTFQYLWWVGTGIIVLSFVIS